MSDGRDDNNNWPAKRGAKLRYNGDELGDKPEYSDDLDWPQGSTPLNQRTRMSEEQQCPNKANHALRGKTGLIFKEPLS